LEKTTVHSHKKKQTEPIIEPKPQRKKDECHFPITVFLQKQQQKSYSNKNLRGCKTLTLYLSFFYHLTFASGTKRKTANLRTNPWHWGDGEKEHI